MFKKILIALAAILVLLVLAGILFFKFAVGPSNSAAFLPASTLGYVSLTDLLQTASRWNQTSLAQISNEPDVKKFLEKPLGKLVGTRTTPGAPAAQSGPKSAGIGEVLLDLKPNRIFASVQKLTEQELHLVVGLQHWGGAASFHRAVGELTKRLANGKTVTPETESYGDFTIETYQLPNLRLSAARWKNWGLLANDPAALKAVLDSATKADIPKLADDPIYQSTIKPLNQAPDLLAFLRVAPVLDTLLAAGQRFGASAIPQQVEAIREAQAIGFSSKLDGANIQDVLFIRTLKPLPMPPRLTTGELEFTNVHTIGFFEFAFDWDRLKPDEKLGSAPGTPAAAIALLDQLHHEARDAFGSQAAVVVNWPDGAMRPQAGLVIPAQDRAKAQQFIEQTLASFTGQASIAKEGDTSIYQFDSAGGGLFHPSLALVDSYVIAAVDANDLQGILASRRDNTTLAKNPRFAKESSFFKSANRGFGYIDAAAIFEQSYGKLRPVLQFAAAVSPSQSDLWDLSSLPETANITKHLNPIVYSQRAITEGLVLESRGPITINQAAALLFGLGWQFGASALPLLQ